MEPLQANTIIDFVKLAGVVIGIMTTAGGFAYWVIRRSVSVATKNYVDEMIAAEVRQLETRANDAYATAAKNEEELQHLRDLLEGGNSKFEKGIMDYLDENIERTKEVKADVEQIRESMESIRRAGPVDDPAHQE